MYEIDSRMYELAVFRSLERYPYSKMCELCELCELFVKKRSASCDLSARMGGIMGPPKIFDFWGELKPKSPQLLRSSGSCDLSAESESALSSRTAHS